MRGFEAVAPDELEAAMDGRLAELAAAVAEVEARLAVAPEGSLRIRRRGEYAEFYRVAAGGGTRGVYIPKAEADVRERLAQKGYDRKALSLLRQLVSALDGCLRVYGPAMRRLLGAAGAMNDARRQLVTPVTLADEDYAAVWKERMPASAVIPDAEQKHWSLRGLPVRSKSEEMIANLLDMRGIPFCYESPLPLESSMAYPDFTCLNVRTRKVFVWEHFGMMDDTLYCEKAVQKMARYQQAGYFPGDRLIISMETRETPLSSAAIEQIIRKYLL